MSIRKIFWTTTEKEKVALKAYELILDGSEKSYSSAIYAASVSVLHPDRIRQKTSVQSGPILIKELQQLGRKLYAEKVAKEEQERLSAVQLPPQPEIPIPEPVVESPIREQLEEESQSNFQFDALIQLFVNRIGDQFKIALSQKLSTVVNEVFESVHKQAAAQLIIPLPERRTQPKTAKPKVVIVGLLAHQAREVEKDFAEYFNLDFIETDKSQRLKSAAGSADHVILNTRFINHSIQTMVRQHPGLILADGGVTKIKDVLLELACKL